MNQPFSVVRLVLLLSLKWLLSCPNTLLSLSVASWALTQDSYFCCALPEFTSNVYNVAVYLRDKVAETTVCMLITLCMKLPWFCHTKRGQLFCNCPLFVITIVPRLFFAGKTSRDVLSFCCCLKMAKN